MMYQWLPTRARVHYNGDLYVVMSHEKPKDNEARYNLQSVSAGHRVSDVPHKAIRCSSYAYERASLIDGATNILKYGSRVSLKLYPTSYYIVLLPFIYSGDGYEEFCYMLLADGPETDYGWTRHDRLRPESPGKIVLPREDLIITQYGGLL